MTLSTTTDALVDLDVDVLVLPLSSDPADPFVDLLADTLGASLRRAVNDLGDTAGDTALLYPESAAAERVALASLGATEDLDAEALRKARGGVRGVHAADARPQRRHRGTGSGRRVSPGRLPVSPLQNGRGLLGGRRVVPTRGGRPRPRRRTGRPRYRPGPLRRCLHRPRPRQHLTQRQNRPCLCRGHSGVGV